MSEARILLVDDEKEYLEVLSERLEARGIDVTVASDGRAALDRSQEGVYDLVLLDMKMPGMDGLETLRRLKAANPDLEVVLVTGHATVENVVSAMKLGARDLLEKPADIQSLIERAAAVKAERLLLVEKRAEAKIRDILSERGW